MEHVACDFCGESNTVEVTRQTDILHRTTDEVFTIVRCAGCGLQYLNPRPTPDEIGRYYAEHYSFHIAPTRFRRVLADTLAFIANSPLCRLAGWLPYVNRKLGAHVKPRIADPVRPYLRPGAGRRILDIGCGAATSAHFWGHRGSLLDYRRIASVCGVEVDDAARAALEAKGIAAFRAIDDIATGDRFDVIRMNWSLEHVHSPTAYFKFIGEHLTAQGKAVIAVPNYDGLLYRVAPDCVELPIHLYHFRPQDILNYARKSGLNVIESRTFSYPEMYVVAAAACASLHGLFDVGLGAIEARQMQKTLSRFDALGLGNDMLFVLEKGGMSDLNAQDRRWLHSIYAPPVAHTGWRLENLVEHERVRYFAYGRHALVEALRAAGADKGDTVLLPEFICREVLSALHACSAHIAYYAVDQSLALAGDPAKLPAAKAIVAVDYFGFAQNLAPFTQYCKRSGAVLIEDNAHGLFSRDECGRVLGTRGDLGVFSLRKTLPAPDGAALTVNNPAFVAAVAPQLPFDAAAPGITFRLKNSLRKLAETFGPWPAQAATAAARSARWLKTGHAIPPSSPQSEFELPAGVAPNRQMLEVMAQTDAVAECARRCALYRLLPALLDPARYPPVFPLLPQGTVPYGYPFIANAEAGLSASRTLARHGLECFQWPALPDAIATDAPAHYKSVWMVSFLW